MQAPRFYYLDSLRALIMSIGVVLHSSLWAGISHPVPLAVSTVSSLFRMKMFAILAGYFAALVVSRRGMAAGVTDRAIRFGVPAAVFIAVFNPLTIYLYFLSPLHHPPFLDYVLGLFSGEQDDGREAWHLHIWFLVVMLIYSVTILPVLGKRLQDLDLDRLIPARIGDRHLTLLLALGSSIVFVAARSAHYFTSQKLLGGTGYNFIAQSLYCFAVYFIIGIAIFGSKRLFAAMHTLAPVQMLIAVALYAGFEFQDPALEQQFGFKLSEAARHFSEAFCGFYICVFLLFVFSRFVREKNEITDFLSKASYTVYLFHMLCLVLVQKALIGLGVGGFPMYLLAIPLAYAACLAIHVSIVERNRWTAFLLNGKPLPPAAKPVSA